MFCEFGGNSTLAPGNSMSIESLPANSTHIFEFLADMAVQSKVVLKSIDELGFKPKQYVK